MIPDNRVFHHKAPHVDVEDFYDYGKGWTSNSRPFVMLTDRKDMDKVTWLVERADTEAGAKRIATSSKIGWFVLYSFHDRDAPTVWVKEKSGWRGYSWEGMLRKFRGEEPRKPWMT